MGQALPKLRLRLPPNAGETSAEWAYHGSPGRDSLGSRMESKEILWQVGDFCAI